MRVSASFLDIVSDVDFYGGFADVNGDGRDDLLILVEHERTCNEDVCDFFVFELVVENRQIKNDCDWQLVDDNRRPVRRTPSDRFLTVGNRTVLLEPLPDDMACTLNHRTWRDYFLSTYRRDPNFESE